MNSFIQRVIGAASLVLLIQHPLRAQHFSVVGFHFNFDLSYVHSPITIAGPGEHEIGNGDGFPVIISPNFGYHAMYWNDKKGSKIGHHLGFDVGIPLHRYDISFGFRWLYSNTLSTPPSEWSFRMKNLINQPNMKIFKQTYIFGLFLFEDSFINPRIYAGLALNNIRFVESNSPFTIDDFTRKQVKGLIFGTDIDLKLITLGIESELGLNPIMVNDIRTKPRFLSASIGLHL